MLQRQNGRPGPGAQPAMPRPRRQQYKKGDEEHGVGRDKTSGKSKSLRVMILAEGEREQSVVV